MPGVAAVRDLVFGRGEYTREGAPEPTLLPTLLGAASRDSLARIALSLEIDQLGLLHPGVGRMVLATILARLQELSLSDQALVRRREPVRSWLLLVEAAQSLGAERTKLIDQVVNNPAFGASADFVAAVGHLLAPTDRSELLTTWLKDAPRLGNKLGLEWTCWALCNVAPLVPERFSENMQTAFAAARALEAPWQRADALRQLLLTLTVGGGAAESLNAVRNRLPELVPPEEPWRSHLTRYIAAWARGSWPIDQRTGHAYAPFAQVYDVELRRLLDESRGPDFPVDQMRNEVVHSGLEIPGRSSGREPEIIASIPRDMERVLDDGIGTAVGRWSGRRTAAYAPRRDVVFPPPPPAPGGAQQAPPAATRSTPQGDITDTDEFTLGVGRSSSATRPARRAGNGEPQVHTQPPERKKPRRRPRVVNTGFAETTAPGEFHDPRTPLEPGRAYYYWLEIKKHKVKGSMDVGASTLPDQIPTEAELTVALFALDGGFELSDEEAIGSILLTSGGSSHVVAQPARQYANASPTVIKERLLFPVRAPRKAGRYRLRANVYYEDALMQSRLVVAHVGVQPPRGESAQTSIVDYTLSSTLAPQLLHEIEARGMSVMINQSATGSHDLCFYSGRGAKPLRRAVTISDDTLDGAIDLARTALRQVSWGDDKEYKPGMLDRYSPPVTFETLRHDLTLLAFRGYDIYDSIVDNIADGDVPAFEEALKETGTLQIAGKEGLRYVLPASMVYDYPVDSEERPLKDFEFCPAFVDAVRTRMQLVDSGCFQGKCPSRGTITTICPSGFWGFRHAIGSPISLGAKKKKPNDLQPRIRYAGVPSMVVAVSTAEDLTERESHELTIKKLRSEWVPEKSTSYKLAQTREEALTELVDAKPHLVYFYCHGGLVGRGRRQQPYLSVGAGEIISRANLRARKINWDEPKPLVFINGCHTGALDATTVLDLVTGFVQGSHAVGVIGTEITVFEPLAGDFATHFWTVFLSGDFAVGEAIRRARLELLKKGNPLGLVYTPFVFAGTKLEKIK